MKTMSILSKDAQIKIYKNKTLVTLGKRYLKKRAVFT